MKKISLIIFILSVLIISGCVTVPTLSDIPDAKSDETYTATITAQGTAPFTCKQVGATDIGGTLTLAKDCVISGTAPHAVETKIIPFKVEMTDANGNSNTLDMTLTVHPPPVILELPDRIKGTLGGTFKHSFCNPDPGMNCGAEATTPTGGNPPYTFTVSGQPMGLIMSLNGDLKGTIPEQAREGDYNVEVCVKDTKGASDCKNTIIEVKKGNDIEGKWTGTILTTRLLKGYATVEIVEEGDFSFTIVKDSYGDNYRGEGIFNGQITIKASEIYCSGEYLNGEVTENIVDLEISPFLFSEDNPESKVPQFKVFFNSPKMSLEVDCPRNSMDDFDYDYFPFYERHTRGHDIPTFFINAKNGAVYENTVMEDGYPAKEEYPYNIKVEIHKVE